MMIAAQMNMAGGFGGALGQQGLSGGALCGQLGLAGAQAACLAGLGAAGLGGLPGGAGALNLAAISSLGQPGYGLNGISYLGQLGGLPVGQPGWTPDGSNAAQAAAMGVVGGLAGGGLGGLSGGGGKLGGGPQHAGRGRDGGRRGRGGGGRGGSGPPNNVGTVDEWGGGPGGEGAADRHAKKPLKCAGQEVRTVEEASALNGLLELAHDQNGCRFLQDQLDLRSKTHIDLVFEAVRGDVVALSMDPFGNYLVQKLLQYGTAEQRIALVAGAAPSLIPIALNVHGTRVVQKMLEAAETDEQLDTLIGALNARVMDLILDMNGNHVVQRCLASLKPERAAFVYEAVKAECVRVATHRHGCCVLQRCLDHAPDSQRVPIIGNVIVNARKLVLDPFGNYVVQYVLELRQPELTRGIGQALQGSFADLSLQKFSSNVIEKCLQSNDRLLIAMVTSEICQAKALGQLLHDPFANYVVQTLLTVGSDEEVAAMLEKLTPHLKTLRGTLYGKRIHAKLLRRFPHLR